MTVIRQPIVVMLGHIDHGKTSLLDKIRGTSIQKKEAGGITQHIGATEIPSSVIREIGKNLIQIFNIEFKIPGLLFIDTPGHEAFMSLRERGSSIADIAVLVVDITAGFQPQTYESINFLKKFKTPFLIALNKVDLLHGWKPSGEYSILQSLKMQSEKVRNNLERKILEIIQIMENLGFKSDRFDRIKDFKKTVAIVPTSALTGEGIAELLLLLVGLSQKFLEKRLEIEPRKKARGSILEKREEKGIGTVIDVILYDGTLREGDLVIMESTRGPLVTKVRAILKPAPLTEIRAAKGREFVRIKEVSAACGVRIIAPNLKDVIPGSPIYSIEEKKIESIKELFGKEIREIIFEKEKEGIIIRADSLGALEALLMSLKEKNVEVKKADIGPPTKDDVISLSVIPLEKSELKSILCFNVEIDEEIEELAKRHNVKIFRGNIIYKLIEDYLKYREEAIKKRIEEKIKGIPRPFIIKVLPGFVFRRSKPAIFGVEVIKGTLTKGASLYKNGKIVGRVKSIQSMGESLEMAKAGERVAIGAEGVVIGRNVNEGDILISFLTREHISTWEKYSFLLSEDEKEALQEIKRSIRYV